MALPSLSGGLKPCAILLATLTAGASCARKHSITNEGYVVAADGVRLFYQVAGGGLDTIVVIHGGPGAGIMSVRPDVEALGRRHVLIFYDQRGSGRSDLPDTTRLAPNDFANDLDAVRDHFQLTTMTVFASSFGAIVVAQYATMHPGRIAKMIFLGATGPSKSQAEPFYAARQTTGDTAAARQLSSLVRSLFEGTATDPQAACWQADTLIKTLARSRGEFAGWRGSHCNMPPAALRYSFLYTERLGGDGFGDWDFTHALRHFQAPTLVLDGERDRNGLPMERAWVTALPNARLLVIPGAGRSVAAERPGIVFAAIDTFLVGRWPSGAVRQ
jgi:proline iminopeptidase